MRINFWSQLLLEMFEIARIYKLAQLSNFIQYLHQGQRIIVSTLVWFDAPIAKGTTQYISLVEESPSRDYKLVVSLCSSRLGFCLVQLQSEACWSMR